MALLFFCLRGKLTAAVSCGSDSPPVGQRRVFVCGTGEFFYVNLQTNRVYVMDIISRVQEDSR